ncbi:MAG: tRNA preQ1(34) S-adenosylmethionine ribosyltransferase-isomerase QueA [Bryobacteraceae bacterium]|nr:tRNA preQ1(34) S-adenosylmethionine ribosyltransferase-isomerase QueA [Bryobacteraceae bacterium]
MYLADFDYELPPELIAQEALTDRAASRMLVIDRQQQRWHDSHFRELPKYLRPTDCLVANDTRVFNCRLIGQRRGHTGRVEVFLTKPLSSDGSRWDALVRPGRKMLAGTIVDFAPDLEATILEHGEHGHRTVEIRPQGDLYEILDRVGHTPLPPYIHRPDRPDDRERYQTVFARERGSVAAPTASLHFTPEVLAECRATGASFATVTLHVGLGTFESLHSDTVEENQLHTEFYRVPPETVAAARQAERVVGLGTTAVRALESASQGGELAPASGETNLFIYPGYHFRTVGAMLTNFHLPKSSLLVMIGAFGGTELMLSAYRHAVAERYRFFSYGDCMLIL